MSKTVLIVENYENIRHLMRLWLEMYGYRAIESSDGAEAIGYVKKECPDLVLLEINLPAMNGITVTKIIRGLEVGKSIPIIAITANDAFREQALQAGCDMVIGKPIDFENALQAISSYLPS